jgi:predicted nucleic acid-binding protein
MGVILDSSTVIAGERKGKLAVDLLTDMRLALGPEPIALCTVGVIELEHAVWRAKDADQMDRRRRFLEDLFAAVPIHPLSFEIARRAARIDAESKKKGAVIPFQDLIIGVTALEFGYGVATLNIRHFGMIPGLVVHKL